MRSRPYNRLFPMNWAVRSRLQLCIPYIFAGKRSCCRTRARRPRLSLKKSWPTGHSQRSRWKPREPRTRPGVRDVGETTKAVRAYENFFPSWKDADPDTPILREAKAEFATLNPPSP